MGAIGFFVFLIILAIWMFINCIKVVPQAHAYVVERLGAYQATWSVGLHWKWPIIDKVAKKVLLKEKEAGFLTLQLFTRDKVTVQIDSSVFF